MQINQSGKCQRVFWANVSNKRTSQEKKKNIFRWYIVNLAHTAKVCQQFNSRNRKSNRKEELAVFDVWLMAKTMWATNNTTTL